MWVGGVGGRCGRSGWSEWSEWSALWSALYLLSVSWGTWCNVAMECMVWSASVAWMGEVCPARLMTGSNFSPPNFQVLTPVSSPPEKRNSPVRHGTLVVTP